MKSLIFTLFISITCPILLIGQTNHVPNWSFEDTIQCQRGPTISALVSGNCANWRSYTDGTPDFFHGCNPNHVPGNYIGYQIPANGSAYIGVATYATFAETREYVSAKMSPLKTGEVYEVSMSVSLANNVTYASDGLGVWFYDKGPDSVIFNTLSALPNTAQVTFTNYGVIKDTQNWVRISNTFYADSAYDNIVIGGFLLDNQISIDTFNTKNNARPYSYYYIDSVVVKPLFPESSSNISITGDYKLYPNPNNGTFTLSGNTDTDEMLQLHIANSVGQLIYSDTLQPVNGQVHKVFNIQGIATGIYSVTIKGENKTSVFKLSVQ